MKKNFMELLNCTLNKNNQMTVTENGAAAYKSSGNALVDFNFELSSMRNMDEKEVIHRFFDKAFYADQIKAIRYLFYLRDCREGIGERRTFRILLKQLGKLYPESVIKLIKLIPEYGRWDDIFVFLDKDVDYRLRHAVVSTIDKQIKKDLNDMSEGKPISLLAKWLPSTGSKNKDTRRLSYEIRHSLNDMKERDYRRAVSSLRRYLDVVEVKMSDQKWSNINYSAVPSRANLLYKDSFMKHDSERRAQFLQDVADGKEKINAGVLFPHDIVGKYRSELWYDRVDQLLEALWKNLPDMTLDNTLVVRDGSGSMTCSRFGAITALEVATGLAIYLSEHNTGIWKDKFITFSAEPRFIDLTECDTLESKLVKTYEEDECSNTDIEATMDLILETAIENKLTQDQMPKRILICSDMDFDEGTTMYPDYYRKNFLFDGIAKKYELCGYKLPMIIFWKIKGTPSNPAVPLQQNDLGLILCSGFSTNIVKMFMTGKTDPYDILIEAVNSERYNPVEQAIYTDFANLMSAD